MTAHGHAARNVRFPWRDIKAVVDGASLWQASHRYSVKPCP